MKPLTVFTTICLVAAMMACGGGGAAVTRNLVVSRVAWQKISVPSVATQLNYLAFNSSNHWFIADRSHGFYRSTDQGATWMQINSGLRTTLGWTIQVDPANGDLIASTFSGSALNLHPVTFYRSTNEGGSWSVIPTGHLSAAAAETGCVFPASTTVVCGGFWAPSPSSGAWVSTNVGQTTISVSSAAVIGSSVYSLGVNPVVGDLWMGTEQLGIFRSTNNGLTWMEESPRDVQIDPANGIRDGNIYGMTFDRNGNVLFGSQGGIWKSSKTGSGYTWTNVLKNANTSAGKGMGRDANGNLYYGHNSDPTNPTVVYCSTDDGNTWSACDSGIPPFLQGHEVVVNHADGKLYAVTEDEAAKTGTLYRTVNPVQ